MPYGQPAQLANLLPMRGLPQPNNTGKKYEHTSAYILRKYLTEPGATIGGKQVSRFDGMLYKLIADGIDAGEPIDRHRAVNMILDRLEGKPLARSEIAMDVNLNIIGKLAEEMSREEQAHVLAHPEEYDMGPDFRIFRKAVEAIPAEFTDLESGESEPDVTN